MKTFKESVKFQLKIYLISNKILVPFILLIAYLYFDYNHKPIDLVGNYNVSAVVCFYLMFWIGIVYNDVTDITTEQLLILKLQSHRKYYLCNEVVLCILAGIFSMIVIGYSFLANLANAFDLFINGIDVMNVIYGLILHFVSALCGAMVGSLFQYRIFKDKKTMMCIAFVVAIIAIAKDLVIKALAVFKYVVWIFPPIADFIGLFRIATDFTFTATAKGVAMMLIYAAMI